MNKYVSLVILTLLLGFLLRMAGNNWDSGFHLHPDERMLMIVTQRITLFSQLDPDFFNYGSFPIYLVKITGAMLSSVLQRNIDSYDGLLVVGRSLATIVDTVTIGLVMILGWQLSRNKWYALFAGFMYATLIFPIQNSNFFIVDPIITCLLAVSLVLLLAYLITPRWSILLAVGISLGLALSTKITALLLLPVVLLVISYRLIKSVQPWSSRLIKVVGHTTLVLFSTVTVHFLSMPYAFIRYPEFIRDITLQLSMNQDAYVFPYTLQYVGTLPYLYHLKNMFLWGIGPVAGTLAVVGMWYGTSQLLFAISSTQEPKQKSIRLMLQNWWKKLTFSNRSEREESSIISKALSSPLFNLNPITFTPQQLQVLSLLVIIGWSLLYFLILGKSAVKFMRYMLPLYPSVALLVSYGGYLAYNHIKQKNYGVAVFACLVIVGAHLVATFSFLNIYTAPNARVSATSWILNHVPSGSTLAVEHWDDRLPIINADLYNFEELELYNFPDTPEKMSQVYAQLDDSDYLILASNRLYTPLQKLADCSQYIRCYPLTAEYYQRLFAGELEFKLVAEFHSKPQLLGLEFDDQAADESFTVYDHPRVLIFKRTATVTEYY